MKKIFFTIAFYGFCAPIGLQAAPAVRDSVKVVRMKFVSPARRMADKLMLDDKTAGKFVTLYEDYLKELKEAADKGKDKKIAPEDMTDAQITKQIERNFDVQQKKLDIRKKYFKKFSGILTPKQTYELFQRNRRPDVKFYPFPGIKPKIETYGFDKDNFQRRLDKAFGALQRIGDDGIGMDGVSVSVDDE